MAKLIAILRCWRLFHPSTYFFFCQRYRPLDMSLSNQQHPQQDRSGYGCWNYSTGVSSLTCQRISADRGTVLSYEFQWCSGWWCESCTRGWKPAAQTMDCHELSRVFAQRGRKLKVKEEKYVVRQTTCVIANMILMMMILMMMMTNDHDDDDDDPWWPWWWWWWWWCMMTMMTMMMMMIHDGHDDDDDDDDAWWPWWWCWWWWWSMMMMMMMVMMMMMMMTM